MSKQVFVRLSKKSDGPAFCDWATANLEKSSLDPSVVGYPTTIVVATYDETGTTGFMPIQTVPMLESFAPRPGLSSLDAARSLAEIVKFTVTQCHLKGHGEMYFLGSDEDTNKFAENHGFEEVKFKVYRMKVPLVKE